jgi:hypothetical protein
MKTRKGLAPLIASIAIAGPGAFADVLPPQQDSSSLKGKLTAVTGRATTLPVSATRKSFVLFDLNNLPADVESGDIAQARLRVYFPSAKKPGIIVVHTVTAAWDEKTAAEEPGISASAIAVLPAASVVAKNFVEVDVTNAVRAWRDGTEVNNGFAFLGGETTNVTLGAKEGTGNAYPCELEVQVDRAIGGAAITAADASTLIDVTNTGTGGALRGVFGNTTGTVPGVRGESNSTSANAAGVIGIMTSSSPGGFSAGVRGINSGTGGLGIGVYGSQGGSGWGVYGTTPSGIGVHGNSTNGFGLYGVSTNGTGIYGLSTNGPAGQFEITNQANSSTALSGVTNGTGPAISGTQSGTAEAGLFSITNAASTSAGLTVKHAGIGTGVSVQLTNASDGGRGIDVSHAGVGPGVFSTSQGGNAVWGIAKSISAAGVIGDNTFGEAVVGRVMGDSNDPTHNGDGVGAVVGRNDMMNGYGVRGFCTKTGAIGVFGQAGISGGINIAAKFENVNAANNSDVLQVRSSGNGALVVFQKSGANVARIDATGKGFFNGGTQTGGADVAEVIPSTGTPPEPGDVVEIDPDHPLHYRLSSSAGTTMVAGVITTLPGVLMNKAADDDSASPALALVGRVPVKIVGEGGDIRPGDLLIASSTPGRAMRAPAEVKPGTVIGKALQPFAGDAGTIQMLVMTR